MPSKLPAGRFADILREIDLIRDFVTGLTFDGFAGDQKTVHAVERAFQIISEAAVKLGAEAERRYPALPWADIRGLGNHLRHAYDDVSNKLIWESIQHELEPLREVCARELARELERERKGNN